MVKVKIRIGARGITVNRDPAQVPKHKPNELISWTISTPGWRFTRDGIVIHWNLNQFTARGSDHRQEFHWRSRNTNKLRYEYTINVTNGKTCATRDPGIKNGGR